jgi:outer membrane protein assembly complex protein YaeT
VGPTGGDKDADDAPADGPRLAATPRSWRGRALRAVFGLALLGLLLVASLLTFVHTPPGATAVRALLETWGSEALGGRLRLGKVDLRLWRRQAAVTAASLSLDGVTLDVQRFEVDWPSKAGPRVRLLRPRIVVRGIRTPEAKKPPATGLAAQPWRALEGLAGAEVVEGRLELRDAKGDPWLILGRLDASMAVKNGRREIALRVADGAAGWPDGGLRVKRAHAEATLALDGGNLAIEQAHLATGSASIDLRGGLDRLSPLTARVAAHAAIDGGFAAVLSPGTDVSGGIDVEGKIEAKDDRATGTLAFASPVLTVQGVGPWAAEGRGRIDGARLVLDALSLRGTPGRVDAEGSLALLGTARTEVRLRVADLDAASLARSLSGRDAPVATRVGGALSWSTTGWDIERGTGEGRLALRPAEGRGLPLAGDAAVRVAGRGVGLDAMAVEAHGARVTGDVWIGGDGAVSGRWKGELPLGALPALLGDLAFEGTPPPLEGTLFAEAIVAGSMARPSASLRLRSDSLSVRGHALSLGADAHYDAGRLALAPLVLRSGTGHATVSGSMPVLAESTGGWDLGGDVDALDVGPVLALGGLDGHGPLTGTLRVTGPRDEPIGRVSLGATATLRSGKKDGDTIVLALEARSRGKRVDVERLKADLADGRVVASGSFDAITSAIEAKAKAERLDWARLPLLPAALGELRGTLGADVALSGTTAAPSGEARVVLGDPTLNGAALPSLTLDARADGRDLRLTGEAKEVFLRGNASLQGGWPLRVEIDASALPLQSVLDTFAWAKETRATVTTSGSVVVEGPLREPSAIHYSTSGLAAAGRVRGLEWKLAPFVLRGDGRSVEIEGFRATAGEARLSVGGRAALASGEPFDLSVESHLDLADLDPAFPASNLDGTGDLKLHVGGTFDSAELGGTLGLKGVGGRSEDTRWRDLDLDARFSGGELHVERLQASLLGGTVAANGAFPLLRRAGAGLSRITFAVQDVDLARALDQETREAADSPSLVVSVKGEGEAREPTLEGLQVRGQVTRLESKTSEGALALEAPADWSLERGRFELPSLRLTGAPGKLEGGAEGQLLGPRPRWSAALAGQMDLRVISPFLTGVTLSGPARIDARLSRAESWRLDGSVRLDQGRLSLDALNLAVSQLSGELRLEGDRVSLEGTGAVGDGRLRASGGMRLGESLLGPAALKLTAERVPINYPPGFRGRATGEVRLVGEPGHYRVEGDVGMRQAYYTAAFDAKSQALDRLDWQLAALEGGSVTDNLALDVRVRLDEPLRIRNSQLRVDMEGALAASGTLAQPTVGGQVALHEGGEFTIGRARVRVSEGRIELNDYPAGTPTVDLRGTAPVGGIAVDLRARGSLDDLDIQLSSDRSDLSQTDLVTLVMTGRTASAAASQSGVVVAEELASALGGALQKGVGESLLIDVSPDRSLLTDDTDPTQRFNLGTRINQNLTVVYSAALDGTEKRWIVEFNPGGGRFRFRAISEEDSSYSFELTDRFSFDLSNRGSRQGKGAKEIERLASLHFEGTLPVPEKELEKATKLKTRRRYSALQRDQAADRVRAWLALNGWRSATVDADSLSARTPEGPGGGALVLRVEAGLLVPIEWRGDDPGKKTRKEAELAWPAFATTETAAAAVARAARFRLQAQGYYTASVEPKVVASEGRANVTFQVTRGPKGNGVDVVFDGNTSLDDATLLAALPKPGSDAFFEALDPRSSRISNDVRLAYAGIGHLRARAGLPRSSFDAASGRLGVTIPIRERAASQVANIQLPAEFAAGGAKGPTLKLTPGRPFDLSAYVADRDAIAAWYRTEGWLDATVRASLEPRGHSVSIQYLVEAGPRPTVGDVRIAQVGKTRESLVRRALTVSKGDVVRSQALAESRERLSEMGVFSSVEVRAEPRPGDDAVRDVVVGLTDKPDVQLEYGVRYTTSGEGGGAGDAPSSPSGARWQVAGALEFTNPFGLGWKLRTYSFVTTKRQTWGVNLDAATLLGHRVRTQLFVFDDTDEDIQVSGFASRVRGVTAQQTYVLLRDRRNTRWHDRLRVQWGYSFKNVEYVQSADAKLVLQGDRGFATLALIGDDRDSFTDPKKGIFWTATSEIARTGLGSDVDYCRLYGQLFTYLPLGPVVWAQGYRIGTVPGVDPLLLIENRFRAGGPTTVRGFEQNALGPKTVEGDSLGGQAVAVINQELRFPIWKSLKGGLFWEAGNVWLTSKEFDLLDLRQSVGLGLRYMFPFGPIRLEYAWVVKPEPGEAKGRLLFGLGHAF